MTYFILTLTIFTLQSLFICSPLSQHLQYPGRPLLHHMGTTRMSDSRCPPKLHSRAVDPRAPNLAKATALPAVVHRELLNDNVQSVKCWVDNNIGRN
ncbi:hypothetical protein DFH08DRAFT_970247 [Mycena albidolilacea]|uniref:Secreted protein n=1 Tax=Mycena albidolilacea TaxID=1033008 RepID=A0AAD6ZGM7_9AGAR|nr:hypothetical protein DFH08DRAFT_970247 [Mycena albidolilacea]